MISKNRLITSDKTRLIEYKRTPQGKIKFTIWELEKNDKTGDYYPTRPILNKIVRPEDLLSFLEKI